MCGAPLEKSFTISVQGNGFCKALVYSAQLLTPTGNNMERSLHFPCSFLKAYPDIFIFYKKRSALSIKQELLTGCSLYLSKS